MLTYGQVKVTVFADVCSRMLTYAHVCSRMLTYGQVMVTVFADVCSRMLTYAHVCSCMLTYAHVWTGEGDCVC